MDGTIDLEKARESMAIRKGFRNWKSHFSEDFGTETRLSDISTRALMMLTEGRENSTFYLLDLIMNLHNLGSGFEFHELNSKDKMRVMDAYLFLLDRTRFEWMKRLGWLDEFPGEECRIVELVKDYEELSSRFQSHHPTLSRQHPLYEEFQALNACHREELIRKLIPDALNQIEDQSTTL